MFVGHYDLDGTLHFRHEADDHKTDLSVSPGPAGAVGHTCPGCAESIEVLAPPIRPGASHDEAPSATPGPSSVSPRGPDDAGPA
jgi:hypothetical protein